MKHHEKHGFHPAPLIDAHLHHVHDIPAEETVASFARIIEHFNLSHVLTAALTSYSVVENVLSLYCKSRLAGRVYAAASLNHHYDERDTADFYLAEIKKYHAMGFDGIKMLEGKPSMNRTLRTPCLSDAVYEPFFAYAEENGIPLLVHLGDPEFFWDITKMDDYAIKHGWYNPPGSKTLEALRAELEAVLAKFPRIKMTLAHFYFMDGDLARLDALLSTYPGLAVDLTPGTHFIGLSEKAEEAREFFLKHRDRLIFGTDTYNVSSPDAEAQWRRPCLTRAMLEKSGEHEQDGRTYRCLALPREVQEDIYFGNFKRMYGAAPCAVDAARTLAECRLIASERPLTPTEAERLTTVTAHFEAAVK